MEIGIIITLCLIIAGIIDYKNKWGIFRLPNASKPLVSGSLPILKLEYHEIKSDTAYGKFHSWTAELVGIKGMVAEAGTKEGAIKELMKSIEVKLLYDMEHRQ